MRMFRLVFSLAIVGATCKKSINTNQQPQPASARTVKQGAKLVADGPGNTYELINSVFGNDVTETPDCAHPAFGRHIREEFDHTLNKNVFVFTIHVTPDNDRCVATDRQRTEIKTYGPSHDTLKGQLNETVTYRWKFMIGAGFQPSPKFTHIHQLKAGDGTNADMPVMTITPRAGNPEKLEFIHNGNITSSTLGKVKSVDLAPFKGTWVEVMRR
jgi:hypothetical protein